MAWEFKATCPDCQHTWVDMTTSLRLGPKQLTVSLEGWEEVYRIYKCRACFRSLSVPRVIDHNSWQKWAKSILPSIRPKNTWLLALMDRIDQVLVESKPYAPVKLILEPLRCQCGNQDMIPADEHELEQRS